MCQKVSPSLLFVGACISEGFEISHTKDMLYDLVAVTVGSYLLSTSNAYAHYVFNQENQKDKTPNFFLIFYCAETALDFFFSDSKEYTSIFAKEIGLRTR